MSVIKNIIRKEKMDKAHETLALAVKERPLVSGDEKILVLGAGGQVANYLVPDLKKYYSGQLLLTDVKADADKNIQALSVTDPKNIRQFIKDNNVKVIINLAALLSGAASKDEDRAMEINIQAPIAILKIAEEEAVRKVFTPSSIAVMGSSAENGHGIADIEAPTYPHNSPYGDAKKVLEALSQAYSNKKKTSRVQATCLRYGGVLACSVPPSDGTTEEIDRMIVAAAEFKAKKGENLVHSKNGVHHPLIPPEAIFPMLDGRSVGLETMRFLHADPEKIRGHETHYHLAEYRADIRGVENLLKTLAPGFTVEYRPELYDKAKEHFTKDWPKNVDTKPSQAAWDMQKPITMAQSVQYHFDRLVEQFKAQEKERLGVATATPDAHTHQASR